MTSDNRKYLSWKDTNDRCSSIFDKGDNFCDFPFASRLLQFLYEKKNVYSKMKEFAPTGGDPFQKEAKKKKTIWQSCLPWKCHGYP